MFLTYVLDIIDPLSLSVKLHHCNLFIYIRIIVIKVWPKLLIKKKMKINVSAFLKFLVLTFENCSKFCGYFNPLFIKQIKKKIV
jgi:hypothetical protein